ncbi:hypothetical protein [Shewanella halifaxensis]|uniref:hypothetical protein n=1 Tax=Shewanella halifaxensis TaxID=271098 RepID=UPI00059D41B2|nr:hypothetical protein [Shewanella halifaxensis]
MFFIELFFYFILAGIAIVTWERTRQSKNDTSIFSHAKGVYTHLFITLFFTVVTMLFFSLILSATENEVGVATLTAGISSWFVSGYFLKRID